MKQLTLAHQVEFHGNPAKTRVSHFAEVVYASCLCDLRRAKNERMSHREEASIAIYFNREGVLFVAYIRIVGRSRRLYAPCFRFGLGSICFTGWEARGDAAIPERNGQCRSTEAGVR